MSRIAGSRADYLLPVGHPLLRAEKIAAIVGLAGLVLSVIGLVADREQFFQSWLIAYLFWLGPTLGSMGILMLQHITGGRWGVALRRTLEAAMKTLPLMALFFLPIVVGMHFLFEWTHADVVANDPVLQVKSFYLNEQFAARSLAAKAASGVIRPEDITEDILAAHLDTGAMPDPDLLIRTGGDMRVSNFLLWQIAYAEICVTPTLWPDFDRGQFLHLLEEFRSRERRFGRTD